MAYSSWREAFTVLEKGRIVDAYLEYDYWRCSICVETMSSTRQQLSPFRYFEDQLFPAAVSKAEGG